MIAHFYAILSESDPFLMLVTYKNEKYAYE